MIKRETTFPKLAIVIPALNEEEGIGQVIDEISKVFYGNNYSVIVVDGNSEDDTAIIARKKGAIVIGQLGKGYGDALLSGFIYAVEELDPFIIAMMDADMTYDPKDILVLTGPILKGDADLVIGNRFLGMEEGSMTLVNRVGNRFLSTIFRLFLRINVYDTQCGIRVFKADLLNRINLISTGMPFATEMLAEAKFAGASISEEPVSYRPRVGEPKLVPLKDGLRIFVTILRLMRDTKPLLFFGGLGFILGIMGFILGLDVTLEWLKTHSITRLPTIILSVLLLIGAMQFFTLGLIADMIKGLRKKRIESIRKNRRI